MAASTDDLAALLRAFATHVDLVWQQYEAHGPGEVDSALIEPIDQLAPQLAAMLDGPLLDVPLPEEVDRVVLAEAIRQATDLARRCVTLSQGLCFVSGEAGLVPRRDQVNAFAAARGTVDAAVERLGGR